jgi:molybdenum cofactor sulfurtransferase
MSWPVHSSLQRATPSRYHLFPTTPRPSNISLRTGCVCNPGGAAALLGMQAQMECIEELIAREGWKDEVGVVRLSLGIGNDFEDVWKVVQWAKV